jgi:hypothetical protein
MAKNFKNLNFQILRDICNKTLRLFPCQNLAFLSLLLIILVPSLKSPRLMGSETPSPVALLQALDSLEFDFSHVIKVSEITIHRGSVSITMEHGHILFLKPVNGFVTGLYFFGQGTILAIPPDRIEKQQLNLFTGAPILNEHFLQAYLRFTDDTFEEITRAVEPSSSSEENEFRWLEEKYRGLVKTSALTNYRIVSDLTDGRKMPMFYAQILGQKLGLLDFSLDQRKSEDLILGQYHQKNNRFVYDTWCRYSSRPGPLSGKLWSSDSDFESGNIIDVHLYDVETQIDSRDILTGTTQVEFEGKAEGEWVLSFDLSRRLKVSKILNEKGESLNFFQNGEFTSEKEVSRLGHDVVLVLLDEPLQSRKIRKLKFQYEGDVISRIGSGVFYVGSRGSWYPNTGYLDFARYHLKFRCPKPFTVVATGDRVREWEEAGQRFSSWKAETEIPMAGFNYGDYIEKKASAGPIPIEVFVNRGIENVYLEVMSRREQLIHQVRLQQLQTRRPFDSSAEIDPHPPDFTSFDTTLFADNIAERVASILQYFVKILGSYPYTKLSVSQIPGLSGQGWPSLLYVSSLSFFSPRQRAQLGLSADQEAHYWECLHAHEIAHQWWGNQTVGRSYRDLWIFEGFANYLGYLSLTARYPTETPFREVMRRASAALKKKNDDGIPLNEAGPVWLGTRLVSSKFPRGYYDLVYEKGAWILHMIRYLYTDPITGSEQLFQEALRDYLSVYRGKLAGTDELKNTLEKRLPKRADLEGNGKLDWFFDEWVYDTGIPLYRLAYTVASIPQGGFQVKGKILQTNVPDTFMMPLELFAYYGPDKSTREKVQRIVTTGTETPFRLKLKRKPTRLTLDENEWVLCDNQAR